MFVDVGDVVAFWEFDLGTCVRRRAYHGVVEGVALSGYGAVEVGVRGDDGDVYAVLLTASDDASCQAELVRRTCWPFVGWVPPV